MASTVSRTEAMLSEIITEFQTISVANGYRTTPARVINSIRDIDKIANFPEIGIELGEERMTPIDDKWTVFDTTVEVFVVGSASANSAIDYDASELTTATEALRHDIKRIVYSIMSKYINGAASKWNVTPKQTITTTPVMGLGENRNKAYVVTSFTVRIRTQGSTFVDTTP